MLLIAYQNVLKLNYGKVKFHKFPGEKPQRQRRGEGRKGEGDVGGGQWEAGEGEQKGKGSGADPRGGGRGLVWIIF